MPIASAERASAPAEFALTIHSRARSSVHNNSALILSKLSSAAL